MSDGMMFFVVLTCINTVCCIWFWFRLKKNKIDILNQNNWSKEQHKSQMKLEQLLNEKTEHFYSMLNDVLEHDKKVINQNDKIITADANLISWINTIFPESKKED